jgi:hypothetical protein
VQAIDETAYQHIDYPDGGEAQIAETVYGERRLIVRRTRLVGAQDELFSDWRHFAMITNRADELAIVEAEHRDHAVVEQVIADLKDQALAHFPSGDYDANAAWTVLAAVAHTLLRSTQLLGLPDSTVRAARTLRRRLIQVPGANARSPSTTATERTHAPPNQPRSRPPPISARQPPGSVGSGLNTRSAVAGRRCCAYWDEGVRRPARLTVVRPDRTARAGLPVHRNKGTRAERRCVPRSV